MVDSSTGKTQAGATEFLPEQSLPLRQGSSGEAVAELQIVLRQLGYYNGPIDGVFGVETAAAVKAFQAASGFQADGVVGTGTRAELVQLPPSNQYSQQLKPIMAPHFSPMTLANTEPPPSPLWLVAMPLIPLIGGVLASLQRHKSRQK
mgnify:CR=1 FL=1